MTRVGLYEWLCQISSCCLLGSSQALEALPNRLPIHMIVLRNPSFDQT